MIIKFTDKFDSIFYAVLYNNLTGYYLSSANEPENLFNNETFIDVDNLNWYEILNKHNNNYGIILWFDRKNKDFIEFKKNINLALRYWKPYKYKIIIEVIKQAIRFGLNYVKEKNTLESQDFYKIVTEVNKEVAQAAGSVHFIPLIKKTGKFLLACYEEENQIGDLVINNLKSKYFGYQILIKTPQKIYLNYHDRIFCFLNDKFKNDINDKNLEKFWEDFYNTIFKSKINHVTLV